MAVRSPRLPGLALVSALCLSSVASATVPTYRVEVLATYEDTTSLEGSFANWDVALGFLDEPRRVHTTAVDQSGGANALIRLQPSTSGAYFVVARMDGGPQEIRKVSLLK